MSLSNKVILVSGANRGIGAATVRELLKAGVKKIYAGARNLDSLPDFNDSRVVSLQLDITRDESVQKAADTAKDVDVLVNNAGTMAFGDRQHSRGDRCGHEYQFLRHSSRHPGVYASLRQPRFRNNCKHGQRRWPCTRAVAGRLFCIKGRPAIVDASPSRDFGQVGHHCHWNLSRPHRYGFGKGHPAREIDTRTRRDQHRPRN